jgi:signal transduction histidine kinase
VRRDRRYTVLEVADDGPGVDPELGSRIFQRFASTGGRDSDGRRHYGLGLALVSEIAETHGGQVELATSDQPGARFRVILPTAQPR